VNNWKRFAVNWFCGGGWISSLVFITVDALDGREANIALIGWASAMFVCWAITLLANKRHEWEAM